MKPDGELGRNHSHVAKFQHEVAVPGAAIVLAVRDQLESELFLQSHHLANRGVSVSEISPLSAFSRAPMSAAGLLRLPTWSARKGGLVCSMVGFPGNRVFRERRSRLANDSTGGVGLM